MKIKLFLLILLPAFLNAQKIKWDNLNVRKEVPPSLFIKESPLDVGFLYTSTDSEFFANQSMQYYVTDEDVLHNDFISNNLGVSKLVAVLEYKYAPATLHLIKKDLKNQVVVVSHLYANLLLIDPEKGVFDVQEIKLGDCDLVNPVSNIKGYNTNLAGLDYPNNLNTTLIISDLSDFEANQYRNQKDLNQPRETEVKQVDQIQIVKLRLKVGNVLKGKFLPSGKYVQRAFNYLKEDKEFNGENFNKASQLINTGIDPIDESKIRQAIEIWKTEAASITNLEDKKNKKYYIAIQENILQSYNIIRDFTDTDEMAGNLKKLDSKNEIADALISNKKNSLLPQSNKKEIVYTPLPTRFNKTDVVRFLNKKPDVINPIILVQPGKFDVKLNDMNIYKNTSSLLKETKNTSEKYNLLIDILIQIAVYERNSSNSSLPKEANEDVKNFNLFCKKNYDAKKKFDAAFDFKKEANLYIPKLRNHLLTLSKIEEFTMFNDALSSAIDKTILHTKPENNALAYDFIDLNSAMFLRQIANNGKYEPTIEKSISNINSYLDTKFPVKTREVFFEFKNDCKLIKEKKKFSSNEISNFSNILTLLYTYL